jgi:hypothetical protein
VCVKLTQWHQILTAQSLTILLLEIHNSTKPFTAPDSEAVQSNLYLHDMFLLIPTLILPPHLCKLLGLPSGLCLRFSNQNVSLMNTT